MLKSRWFKLLISLILPNAVGGIASFFTMPAVRSWYVTLAKPSFNPPSWVFAPAWTLLYVMMGIAFFLIWDNSKGRRSVFACWFFIIHLFVNGLWSFLFFGLQSPGLAFINIIILWAMIGALIFLFWRLNKVAAWLMVPYWLWVTFAAFLNYAILRLN